MAEIVGFRPLADALRVEARGAPVALAGVWGRAMDATAQHLQQSWRRKKIKYIPIAPLRRDFVLIYRRVWSSFTGRSILLKVVVGGTNHASNCVIMWLIPSRLHPR